MGYKMRLPEPAATADPHTQQSSAIFIIPPITWLPCDYTSSCPKILDTVARRSPEFRGGAARDETNLSTRLLLSGNSTYVGLCIASQTCLHAFWVLTFINLVSFLLKVFFYIKTEKTSFRGRARSINEWKNESSSCKPARSIRTETV